MYNQPLYTCTICGDSIVDGELYLSLGHYVLCKSCIDDCTVEAEVNYEI